jgi:hypothetical protein
MRNTGTKWWQKASDKCQAAGMSEAATEMMRNALMGWISEVRANRAPRTLESEHLLRAEVGHSIPIYSISQIDTTSESSLRQLRLGQSISRLSARSWRSSQRAARSATPSG